MPARNTSIRPGRSARSRNCSSSGRCRKARDFHRDEPFALALPPRAAGERTGARALSPLPRSAVGGRATACLREPARLQRRRALEPDERAPRVRRFGAERRGSVAAAVLEDPAENAMNPTKKAVLSYGDGKSIEFPVLSGSIGPDVVDIRALYAKTGMFTYDPGFLSTASCSSKITYIDGDQGVLLYRGYPIEQLAVH